MMGVELTSPGCCKRQTSSAGSSAVGACCSQAGASQQPRMPQPPLMLPGLAGMPICRMHAPPAACSESLSGKATVAWWTLVEEFPNYSFWLLFVCILGAPRTQHAAAACRTVTALARLRAPSALHRRTTHAHLNCCRCTLACRQTARHRLGSSPDKAGCRTWVRPLRPPRSALLLPLARSHPSVLLP